MALALADHLWVALIAALVGGAVGAGLAVAIAALLRRLAGLRQNHLLPWRSLYGGVLAIALQSAFLLALRVGIGLEVVELFTVAIIACLLASGFFVIALLDAPALLPRPVRLLGAARSVVILTLFVGLVARVPAGLSDFMQQEVRRSSGIGNFQVWATLLLCALVVDVLLGVIQRRLANS
ncbi:MAG: hypothetical protein A2289_09165 [Deltaproteobacteria bacterium RIFOXYA12_FULL_58_15]|nr:MAG: hypothetical protein A2289_09165 [Deltaproteobacteria bacterium RIFOXYA12_FULL_58_15]